MGGFSLASALCPDACGPIPEYLAAGALASGGMQALSEGEAALRQRRTGDAAPAGKTALTPRAAAPQYAQY